MFLRVTDVVAGYRSGPDILNGLSLDIEEGRTYCIIGPNGAGKSTLLKVIAGILAPRQGSIRFRDEEVGGLRPDELLARGICFVPQDPSLFPKMTVRQNLVIDAFLEKDKNVVKERTEEIFEQFPLLAERANQAAG